MSPWVRAIVALMLVGIIGLQFHIASTRPYRGTLFVQSPPASLPAQAQPIDAAAAEILASPEGARVLTHLTHDDVARGIWALAQLPNDNGLALTPAQRASLKPPLDSGATLRASLADQRDAAREAQGQLVSVHYRLIHFLGQDALRAAGKERTP